MLRSTSWILTAALLCSAESANAAGFPQLDTTWYPNQLLWLVICFIALYALVSQFVAPSIEGVLTTRAAAINEAIREAERAKHLAESTKGNIESANVDARNKASAFLAKAQAETSANATEALSKLDNDLDKKLAQAEVRIEESKAKALKSINESAASLAGVMASKLLGRDVSQADVEAAMGAAAPLRKKA